MESKYDAKTKYSAFDALGCKWSACRLEYFDDSMISLFLKFVKNDSRRLPIINRGYYSRVQSILAMTDAFLSQTENTNRQIIYLGVGYDTQSFQLLSKNTPNLKIYDVDFDDVIRNRVSVTSDPSFIPPNANAQLQTTNYGFEYESIQFISSDMRNTDVLLNKLIEAKIDVSTPTLIVTECVLAYIDKNSITNIFQSFSNAFEHLSWISFDMMNGKDSFGRMMKGNIQSAGYYIPGIDIMENVDNITNLYLTNGFEVSKALTMLQAYEHFISHEDKARVNRIERFDEVEEWELLMNHYAFSVATKGTMLNRLSELFP